MELGLRTSAYGLGEAYSVLVDPASDSAYLLLNIAEAITRRKGSPSSIQYYAQELKKAVYALTRMNLVMRGIRPANIITREGDSFGGRLAPDRPCHRKLRDAASGSGGVESTGFCRVGATQTGY